MSENIVKPSGPTKASKNDAGGGVLRSEPVMAVVKNNIDPVRMGRIQVAIEDLNGPDPEDSSSWVTVGFLSPFYGRSYPTGGSSSGYGDYTSNPVSYGEWHSPPEIGTRVVCIFVNGDPNYGYYIGAIPEAEALTMIPAIGAVESKVVLNAGEAKGLAGATQLPVTNMNSNNTALAEDNDFVNSPKPVHSYVASILSQQGLIRDNIRGPITSNAQRETPSRVGWGVSTPGRPIYEGGYTDQTIADAASGGSDAASTKITSRRAGHTFVMDDGDLLGKDQLIRLRTALGHQILMSDDGQCLFIIHANGQSWVELGKEGTIDMFSTNSVNIRTQGDLNLHADNNININAKKDLNIKADNITTEAVTDVKTRIGGKFAQSTAGTYASKVVGAMTLKSDGDAALIGGGTTYINGGVVNLNTGSASLVPEEVPPITVIAQTDTLFDAEKGFAPSPAKLQTIVSRAPAHMPWPMAGQGVDVKVELSASAELPTAPSSEVQNANDAAPPVPANPPSAATIATVPDVGAAGGALTAGTTASLVGAAASQASAIASKAVSAGSAITGGVAQLGQLAQNPTQLVTGGAVKPGADTLVNGLVAQGASVAGALTNNLFTGQGGAGSLQSFVNSTAAQVQSQVNNLVTAQKQLTSAGILTGKENPSAVAGVILAGAQNGVAATANFIKSAQGAVNGAVGAVTGAVGAVTGQLNSLASGIGNNLNSIAQNISSGNFASNLSANISGGLGGLTASLGSALDKAKGAVTSAFNSIVGAYKSFKPNVPQDLKAIAEQAKAEAEKADSAIGAAAGALSSAAGSVGSALGSAAGSLSSAVNSATGSLTSAVGSITSGISDAVSSAAKSASNLASATTGLQGLSGGLNSFASTVNNAAGALNKLPGASVIGNAINNAATGLMNGISSSVASLSSAVSNITGASNPGSLVSGLSSTVNSLTAGVTSSVNSLTSGLTNSVNSLTSGLTKGLSGSVNSLTAGLTNSVNSLTAGLSSGLNNLTGSANSLLGSVSSLLPKNLSAQLNSAISALSSAGPGAVKMPIVAVGTVNRDSITSQLGSILGNSKIPAPNYSSSLASYYEAETKKLQEQQAAKAEKQKVADEQFKVAMTAKSDYQDAINNLPEGDPGIATAKEKFYAERSKWYELSAAALA